MGIHYSTLCIFEIFHDKKLNKKTKLQNFVTADCEDICFSEFHAFFFHSYPLIYHVSSFSYISVLINS